MSRVASMVRPAQRVEPRDNKGLMSFFVLQMLVVVLLQKVGLPPANVDVTLPVFAGGLLCLFMLGKAQISPARLGLFAIFMTVAVVSQLLAGRDFAILSVVLLFVLFFSTVFRFDVPWATYLKAMDAYQVLMLAACALVAIQDVWQLAIGWRSFPNLEQLLPASMLIKGYVYIQPLDYGSPYIKPSAFFFREVSFVSQFVAIAFIVELALFRRVWRLAIYIGTLFACFAGTGLLLIALVAPVLAFRLPPKVLLLLGLLGIAAIAVALGAGWYEQVSQRVNEVNSSTSSTSGRFIVPFQQLLLFMQDGRDVFFGRGAGHMPALVFVWLPVTKLMIEYGLFTTLLFYAMWCYALFDKGANVEISAGLFVLFNLMGGYLQVAVIVNLCILLGVLLRPIGPRPDIKTMRAMVKRNPPPEALAAPA